MSGAVKHPNLFIIGAPKCGTSSVWAALKESPEVFVPDRKELYFWSSDICEDPTSRCCKFEEYIQLFDGGRDCSFACDASPSYMYSDRALRRIGEFNSDAKYILLLRDPVDFVISWHRDRVLYCEENLDVVSAWRAQKARLVGRSIPSGCRNVECLLYGKLADFGHHLSRVRSIVPAEQVHVIFLEDLRQDVERVVERLGDFLGFRLNVDAFKVRRNVASQYRSRMLQRMINSKGNIWYSIVRELRMRDSLLKRWFKKLVQEPVVGELAPEAVAVLRRELKEEIMVLNRVSGRNYLYFDS